MAMKLIMRTLVLLVFILPVVSVSSAQTGNPYFNVLDPAYGAKCDGSTNDTNSFQAALTAANNNGGGVVFVPKTVTGACIIAGQLTLDGFRNVTLRGESNGAGFGQTFEFNLPKITKPIIRFTGATGPFISMKSTMGMKLQGLMIDYTNSSFTGMIVDLEHTSTGGDTTGTTFEEVAFNGLTATGAACAICGDKAILTFIDRCSFANVFTAIQGTSSSGDYAVNWTISRSLFIDISGPYIANTGSSWSIGPGNTFEMADNNATNTSGAIIDNTNSNQYSTVNFFGNWAGDTNLPNGGTFFKNMQSGFNLTGNSIAGNFNTNNINLVSFQSGITGITITGNILLQFNNLLTFTGSNQNQVMISGNTFHIGSTPGTIGNFKTGAPASGFIVHDDNNQVFYGWFNVSGPAGFANVWVNGTLHKAAGSFKIDHPLDPENKYLSHSFVESSDMMNIYNGVATLDARGRATVKLPAYFEALNKDFRYQLTCVGGAAPVYVAREVRGNSFLIAGGKPGLKVSWQVTGIRQDAYANAHRVPVEEDKSANDRGHYLNPAALGHPSDEAIHLPAQATEPKQ